MTTAVTLPWSFCQPQTSPGSASYAVSRVGYLRTVDPELDQHIRAIEAELGAPRVPQAARARRPLMSEQPESMR